MITKQQIENLKPGDKLIFVEFGQVLSANIGNVFTFSNWYKEDELKDKIYWQCQELHDMGNSVHGFFIYHVEIFDPQKHKNFKIMNIDSLKQDEDNFFKLYGTF